MKTAVFTPVRACVVLFFILACTSLGYAQYSGNIQGVISDPSGAALNGATVTLRNTDTGVSLNTTTSDSGNYRFSSLPPGPYVVTSEAKGFQTTEVKLTLGTAQTQGINLTLPVGGTTLAVNVTGEAPPLDTDDSRIQSTLSADTVRDLPVMNRNIYDVLSVAPGVVGTGTRGPGESPGGGADNFGTQTPEISANGRSYTGNRVLVDGMDASSNIQNGNIILAPPPDAVQEVSLQTNSWDAENSLGSSVLVQITTKSGTNKYHGTGSWFFFDQDLTAKGRFNKSAPPPFKRNDITATFGGPVIKDKTFFFADVERLLSTSSTGNSVQTFESPEFVSWAQANFPNSIGTGLFTQYPLTSVKATGVAMLPNGQPDTADQYLLGGPCPGAQTTITVVGTTTIPCNLPIIDTGNQNSSPKYNGLLYNFRVDQYVGKKDRIYGSYTWDDFDQQSSSPRKGLGVLNTMWNTYAQADWTHTFGSRVLNEMSFAWNSIGGANGRGGDFRVPQVGVRGQTIGFTGGGWGPGEYRAHNYNWKEVLSISRGPHTLKFGMNGTHAIENGDFSPVLNRPSFGFDNLVELVQDNPANEGGVTYNPLTGAAAPVIFGGQTTPWGLFAQDDWKVKSNLSLTLALRWDDYGNHTAWGNNNFQFGALLLDRTQSLFDQEVGNASVRTVSGVFAHSMRNNWSPRIGFAWDPSKSGTWSVRGGIGVYHDWITLGQTVDLTRTNPPGVIFPGFTQSTPIKPVFALSTNPSPPYDFPLPVIPAGSLDSHGGVVGANGGVTSLDRNLSAPLAVNYVVGVEHQLPWKMVVGANYSGSRGYNQLTGTDVNRSAGGLVYDPVAQQYNLTRLNSSFGSIDYIHNGNTTSYNAMILSVRRASGSWGNFQGSYTLSHAKDYGEAGTRFDQDGGVNIPDQHAYNSYLADANWDVRQRLSFSGSFFMPGVKQGWARPLTSGWQLTTLAAIQTGTPFWVIDNRSPNITAGMGGDYNLDGVNYDIPNTPSTNFSGSHSRQSYINGLFGVSDFTATQPTAGTEGNLKRNSYRNPGFLQVDASVLKNTKLPWFGERGSLQVRFDFLNVLNRVNLTGVDRFLGDGSNFGKSSSALSPRQIQLGVRVSF